MKGKEGNGGFLESILMVGSVNAAKQDFFFFSSRRRHTRSKRDWSSDVCLFRSRLKMRNIAGAEYITNLRQRIWFKMRERRNRLRGGYFVIANLKQRCLVFRVLS